MGEVYRARTLALSVMSQSRSFARKMLRARSLDALQKEARSACALNHPNIVTVYEFGEVNAARFIAMELVKGDTLRQLLDSGPIPFRKAVAIAAQIANALSRAHETGLVHRDLKPENLMITADAVAKVLDFGLAKLRGQNLCKTQISQSLRSPATGK